MVAINRSTLTKTAHLLRHEESSSDTGPSTQSTGPQRKATTTALHTGESSSSGSGANPRTSHDSRKVRLNDPVTTQLARRTNLALDTGSNNDTNTNEGATDPMLLASKRRRFTVQGDTAQLSSATQAHLPPEETEGWKKGSDGTYTFKGSGYDNNYRVSKGDDGSVSVTNGDGSAYTLGAEDAKNGVTIDAGDGNDTVAVEGSFPFEVKVIGGRGDDTITAANGKVGAGSKLTIDGGSGNDTITGSSGNDNIDGGDGSDTIDAGDGIDSVRGGKGDDQIAGGAGKDQLFGQEGNDTIDGGDGHDFVQGGAGADTLKGGVGSDSIYGDREDSAIDAGDDEDADLVITEQGSVRATNVRSGDRQLDYDRAAVDQYLKDHPELEINGSADFGERTRADLGIMLTTEQGRGLLGDITNGLKARGEHLSFVEQKPGIDGGEYNPDFNVVKVGQWADRYDDGSTQHALPVLFHELVHVRQDLVTGAPVGSTKFKDAEKDGIENEERQAAGLSWIDRHGVTHAGDEYEYTDNKFRSELGLPGRSSYGGETGDPLGYLSPNPPEQQREMNQPKA